MEDGWRSSGSVGVAISAPAGGYPSLVFAIRLSAASHRPGPSEELAAMGDTRPMTPEQAATLKQLAEAAYELDAFKPNLRRAEADIRIAMLKAKLKLLDGPPHTL
jgi:hypothetical protein